jgi:DNA/RNA endonuclease YhcR with UshA esterase domain
MRKSIFTLLLLMMSVVFVTAQTTVTFSSDKDNTLYQSATGNLSNGAGGGFVAGQTNSGLVRRGLIKFDVSTIPSNATITNVKLTLQCIKTSSGTKTVTLHKANADWGEGASNEGPGTGSNQGNGAAAMTNDATWVHTFFNTSNWTTMGGDFDATSSASTSVNNLGSYDWTGGTLVADVQAWVSGSVTNNGWLVKGAEGSGKSTKHFATKEFGTTSQRPVLEITYTMPTTPDIVISEINYNSPGTDIEYIELYNNGASTVNLNGWTFTQGVTHTFGNISINAGSYLVIAGDSLDMLNNYGVTAYQWNSGGLSNSGEDITIVDANGMTIDSVDYDDGGSWPTAADGSGPSLVLCDVNADNNDPANWSRAYTDAGFAISGSQVYGSPGAVNNCTAPTLTYPLANIGTINTVDANGVADSLGNIYEVRGLVYGIDYDGNAGYSFSLIDATGAINVFSFNDVGSYTSPTEGDSIHVKGTIAQFNGLQEIIPDSVQLISQSNAINPPTVVTVLDESTEMQFIRMNNMTLVTPSQWVGSGSYNVDITDGTNTYILRIDADAGITVGAPAGAFDVIGIGSQFDNSSPYTDGYQILPRSNADIIPAPVFNTQLSFSGSSTTVNEAAGTITVDVTIVNPDPNAATTVDVVIGGASTAISGVDYTFTSPTTLTFPMGSSANQTVSVTIIDDAMQEMTETIVLQLTGQTSGVTFGADSVYTISISDNDGTLTEALILTGIYDGPLSSQPKGYEFYVVQNIPDLSVFGVGAANNGGGSDGIEYTFPAVSATAGDYIYLAGDTAQFAAYFGFSADYETGTATGINGDDAIELFENGIVIDLYGDINMDGTGTAWEYLDTWAYRNCATGPDSIFNVSDWTIAPINNFDGTTTNLGSAVPMPIGTYTPICPQNIIAVDDVVDVPYNTMVTFMPLANDNIPTSLVTGGIVQQPSNGSFTLNIVTQTATYTPNMNFCGTDIATYEICDGSGCDTATITFNVACPIPYYPIGQVNTVDGNGVADSLNLVCELRGIVYGIDFRGGSGYSFTLIDNTGGINVFNFNDVNGYSVNEGDSIHVLGGLTQFNGLLEIVPDSISVHGSGTLNAPTIVTTLDESTESNLIKVEAVTIIDPTQWTNTGSGFNVDIRNATDTLQMRIVNDCDIFGQAAPTGWFNVTGLGGQFDNSNPFTDGYQIFPRRQSDIELISNTNQVTLENQVRFFPNPTSNLLTIVSDVDLTTIRISNMLGQEVKTIHTPNVNTTISVADLTSGVYTITFVTENGIWTKQFVKQ